MSRSFSLNRKMILQPMDKEPDGVKDYFWKIFLSAPLHIDGDLSEIIQKIILAHETCHVMFCCRSGIHAFHEVALFDQNCILEKKANLFAAEYLLSDRKVFDTLNRDTTFFSAARYVPSELLDFRFRLMTWKGYKLIEPPINARSIFLRGIDALAETSYS